MRKLIVSLAALGVVLGSAEAVTAQAAPTPTHRPAYDSGYTPPPLHWGACADDFLQSEHAQCAMMTVPMDYAHPHGAKIKIAVSRLLHTVPASQYQGVMLVNPGGPGGSGLVYSVLRDFFADNAGASYDWIGFDPRGVGSSEPSLSCDPTISRGDRPPYRPTTRRILAQWVAISKSYAAACARSPHAALFNHVKTTDTVADMESLRKALHRNRINYYGFSYGTYLGQVYATLHPDRVRRMVLDSNVDPQRVFYRSNQDQDRAFQKTFEIYFRWLAKYHSMYHVGNTFARVRSTYLATLRRLDRHAADGVFGGDELTDVFTQAGYYVLGWEDIAAAYSRFLHTGNADQLIALYGDPTPTTPGADNSYAMYLGTQCTDAPWPRSQARLNRDNWRLDRHYYYLTWSNAWFNGPCAYWPWRAHAPVHVTGYDVHVPVLLLDETFDAATPFFGSLLVRKLFPTSALIEGRNGSTHADSIDAPPCTANAIARYLEHGTLPPRRSGNRSDKVCPPIPQPDPTAASSAASTRAAGSRAALVARLEGALLGSR